MGGGVLLLQLFGPHGVDDHAAGAGNAGQQRGRADGQVGQAAVSGKQKHADEGQQNTANFKQTRPAVLLDADHQQDDDGGEVLQNGAHARAGKLDGQKVGELAAAYARQAVNEQIQQVAGIFLRVPRVEQHPAVLDKVERAQDQPSQKQPDRHQPGGVHVFAGEQVLSHAARNTPACRTTHRQAGTFYTVRHFTFPLL